MAERVRVGLNLIFMVPEQTGGMEVAARALIAELSGQREFEIVAFVNREASGTIDGVEEVVVPVNASRRLQWIRGEQLILPRLAERAGCRLVHSLGSTAPWRGAFRRVTTIHDLNYKLVPNAHFGLRGLGMRVLVPLAARRSHRIVVDAESTREDLREHLGVHPSKVDVVPLAGLPMTAAPTPAEELRARLSIGSRPVVLSVSAKRPHKNLGRLIEAHARLPAPRPLLVVPGYPTKHELELRGLAGRLGTTADLALLPWLSASDLEGLYGIADVFVFPSLYEGFGLPVLEAMARDVPVITSDGGSLAEVAGDAAVRVDPESVESIQSALAGLLANPGRREELARAGRERAALFTWRRTAELTMETYRRALTA